ncbi:MAG: exonuclease domain-containing protein [Candidatus Hodgkinia cicadicola]
MKQLIIDTETTGLDFKKDRIIELAIVEFKPRSPIKLLYHSYFNPEPTKVSKEAFIIHGIDNKFLETQPKFEVEAGKILQIVNNNKLIAHNAKFDKQMLARELKLANLSTLNAQWYDTLKLAKLINPNGLNSLRALCKKYKIKCASVKHNALTDCELLALVYKELLAKKIKLSCSESWFNENM